MQPAPLSPSPRRPRPVTRSASAFTLIEVSLSVGIASIALVALLAMLPQGLQTMKRATDLAIEARIHQQIVSEISQADWQRRHEYDRTLRHYDDQGIQLEDSDRDFFIYTARILVPKSGEMLPNRIGGESYTPFDTSEGPGSSGTDEDEVQLVIIEITSSPAVEKLADFDTPETNWRSITTYRATLTRMVDSMSISTP